VTVPTTGETAFVGFGSSVVRANSNAAVQARLNLNSQKIAASYAQDSLCGLIIGDRTAWQGEILESYKDEYQEFDEIAKNDPLMPDAHELKKLETAREGFVSTPSVIRCRPCRGLGAWVRLRTPGLTPWANRYRPCRG
jgi:hypothetical protein